MLRTIGLSDELAPSRNDGSRPALRKNNGNNEIDELNVGRNGVEHAKK